MARTLRMQRDHNGSSRVGRGCVLIALIVAMLLCASAKPVDAEDWPQWRGANRLGIWHETGIIDRFPDDGLKVSWRAPVKSGYAGPAVADGRVFVLDWHEDPQSRTLDGTERVMALDEQTGAALWTHEWETSYRMQMVTYAIGPRATPTVDAIPNPGCGVAQLGESPVAAFRSRRQDMPVQREGRTQYRYEAGRGTGVPYIRIRIAEHGVRPEGLGKCGHFRSVPPCDPATMHRHVGDVSRGDAGVLATLALRYPALERAAAAHGATSGAGPLGRAA